MTMITQRPKHPVGKKLSEAVAEDAEAIKARKGLIDKKATLVKAPDDESDANGDLGATMRPSEEQLSRINQFTKRPVTADEVVAFTTLSCNDIPDRDDDQFTTQCVKDFAELPQPFSPTGKSYMVDHDYKVANAIGRIFGTDTKKISGSLFLTNEVYIPNTAKNKDFIEDLDFGVNWAVSVGVMLGKDECSLSWCKAGFASHGYWCRNGHDKGLFYTEDAEEDAWGFPKPCDPNTKGAEKCIRKFSEPRDMYELSQVFLGAQYYAALEKMPDFKSVMKSVSDAGIPTIGLATEEAEKIPFRHEPKRVSDARFTYGVKEMSDGSLQWVDENGLIFCYDPEDPESGIVSLGKAAINDQEDDDDGRSVLSRSARAEDLGADGSGDDDGEGGEPGSQGNPGSEASDEPGSESRSPGSLTTESPEDDEEDEEDEDPESSSDEDDEDSEDPDGDEESEEEEADNQEEKSVTKKAVLASARKANLPGSVIDAVVEAEGNGLDALLAAVGSEIRKVHNEKSALQEKADLGEVYLKSLRAEALDWYVKAHQSETNRKISIETFERLLDKCGDDVELIKAMSDEQKERAQARFPQSVRRSSFVFDPNVPKAPEMDSSDTGTESSGTTARRARKYHG